MRQLKRFVPPPRPKTHRDYLLEEMVRGVADWHWQLHRAICVVNSGTAPGRRSTAVCHQAWLSEDFRQERRWKVALAARLSMEVAAYFAVADKAALCIPVCAR